MRLEQKLEQMLPDWPAFDITFHELWGDGEGGWIVNDSWTPYKNQDRQETISHLRHRWEIFKLNYLPKAKVKNLDYAPYDNSDELWLEVNCTAFATLRRS